MMTSVMKKVLNVALMGAVAVSIAACGSSNVNKNRIKGDRIAVLTFQQALAPDPQMASVNVVLPQPYSNGKWAQPGGSATNAMHHLSLGGTLTRKWRASIGTGGGKYAHILGEPIVIGDTIYTMDAKALVTATDAASGRSFWRTRLDKPGEKSAIAYGGGLTYGDGRLYATTGYGFVAALDARSGSELWRQDFNIPMRGGPAYANGRVFASTHDNQLYAMDAETGEIRWDMVGIAENAGVLGAASPAILDNTVIAAFSSGELYALQAENGRVSWQDALSRTSRLTPLATLADIDGQPVIDRGRVYANSHSGRMVAIDMRSGERVWEINLGSSNTPWVAGDYLYVLSVDSELVCVSTRDGRIRWVQQLQKYKNQAKRKGVIKWAGPVLAGDRLIIVSSHGYLLSISPYTGDFLSGEKLGDAGYITPVVANDTLYVLTDDGDLVAYQ